MTHPELFNIVFHKEKIIYTTFGPVTSARIVFLIL